MSARRLDRDPTGHPARNDRSSEGRSPGLRVVASVNLPSAITPVDLRQMLAAYSCGGSLGIKPSSLLASRISRHEKNLL